MQRLRERLATRDGFTGDQLEEDDDSRAVVLWSLTQLLTLAVSINLHIAEAERLSSPVSSRTSFDALCDHGVLPEDLRDSLQKASGMRNILLHEYGEIDLHRVADTIPAALGAYERFITAIASWVTAHVDAE